MQYSVYMEFVNDNLLPWLEEERDKHLRSANEFLVAGDFDASAIYMMRRLELSHVIDFVKKELGID